MAKLNSKIPVLATVMVVAMIMFMAQGAQAQCPSNDLTACLAAAETGVQPTEACCSNLRAYADSDTSGKCLCEAAMSSTFLEDTNVNPLYALEIPQKCNLQFPADTTCAGFVIPGGQ